MKGTQSAGARAKPRFDSFNGPDFEKTAKVVGVLLTITVDFILDDLLPPALEWRAHGGEADEIGKKDFLIAGDDHGAPSTM